MVYTRSEHQWDAPLETRPIEEVFVRQAQILSLFIGGQEIQTTHEHPFYVKEKGWIPAKELIEGDLLIGINGEWTPVSSIAATSKIETVYNFRVAEHHTYFVGGDDWGFSIWVHNTYRPVEYGDSGKFAVQGPDGYATIPVASLDGSASDDVVRLFDTEEAAQRYADELNNAKNGLESAPSLLKFGKNAKGHLIKHRDALGYGHLTAQEAQNYIPELKLAVENLLRKADPNLTRVGHFHQHENAIFYISDGKMIITEADGTFITAGWHRLTRERLPVCRRQRRLVRRLATQSGPPPFFDTRTTGPNSTSTQPRL